MRFNNSEFNPFRFVNRLDWFHIDDEPVQLVHHGDIVLNQLGNRNVIRFECIDDLNHMFYFYGLTDGKFHKVHHRMIRDISLTITTIPIPFNDVNLRVKCHK